MGCIHGCTAVASSLSAGLAALAVCFDFFTVCALALTDDLIAGLTTLARCRLAVSVRTTAGILLTVSARAPAVLLDLLAPGTTLTMCCSLVTDFTALAGC